MGWFMTHLCNMSSARDNQFAIPSAAPFHKLQSAIPTFTADAIPLNAMAYLAFKPVVEWSTALLLIVILSPLLAGLALLVKCTSRGPALYSQLRLGRSGRLFRIFKLRTMVHQCEVATGPIWSGGG